jgi:hypothetical protein
MLSDFVTKLIVVLMVVFGSLYIWYSSDQAESVRTEFGENIIGSMPVDIPAMLQESGFGTRAYCPYMNPYMSQLFSAGSIEVGPGNPLHGALTFAAGSDCAGMSSAIFDYDTGLYDVQCSGATVASLSTEDLSEKINEYSKETGEAAYLEQTIPLWQCFVFFGMLPFIAMSLFLRDILGFTMLSHKVKFLIVVFTSIVAVMSGVFAKFVWNLAYIASISVQATFIVIMLVLAFSSVLLSWVGSINAAMGEARMEAAQAASGIAQKFTFGEITELFKKK